MKKMRKALYHSKNIFKKVKVGVNSFFRRWKHIKDIESFDLVVIYREVIPTKSTLFENYISKKHPYSL